MAQLESIAISEQL